MLNICGILLELLAVSMCLFDRRCGRPFWAASAPFVRRCHPFCRSACVLTPPILLFRIAKIDKLFCISYVFFSCRFIWCMYVCYNWLRFSRRLTCLLIASILCDCRLLVQSRSHLAQMKNQRLDHGRYFRFRLVAYLVLRRWCANVNRNGLAVAVLCTVLNFGGWYRAIGMHFIVVNEKNINCSKFITNLLLLFIIIIPDTSFKSLLI